MQFNFCNPSTKKFRASPESPCPVELGRQIALLTNHYHLEIPRCTIYHYDVKIERGRMEDGQFQDEIYPLPRKPKKNSLTNYRDVFNKFLQNHEDSNGLFFNSYRRTFLKPVFDGKQNLYTVRPIELLGTDKLNEWKEDIKLDEFSKYGYRVRIKFAAEVDLEKVHSYFNDISFKPGVEYYNKIPHDAIRALDIILRNGPSINRFPLGNCIFPKIEDTESINIGKGKYVISGHYQSIRPTASGLSLIIDRSSTAVYQACDFLDFLRVLLKELPVRLNGVKKERNIDILRFITYSSKDSSRDIENNIKLLEQELIGIQIEVTHAPSKMKFKLKGFTRSPMKETYFPMTNTDDGSTRDISVEDYFAEKYKLKLNYSNLPCAIVGSPKRPSYLPLEVCQLVSNQQVAKKFNQKELASFIKSCSQDCDKRFQIIGDCSSAVRSDSAAYLEEFSIDLSEQPLQVDGVCLDKPKLSYKDGLFVPETGKWTMNDKKALKGCKVNDRRWYIINFTKQSSELIRKFVTKLRDFGSEKGADIGEPCFWNNGFPNRYDSKAVEDILSEIHHLYNSRKIDRPHLIMFIITRSKDDKIYHEIKQNGDVKYGFNTQCVVESSVKTSIGDKGFFIMSNIFLKMNAKLGGTNNAVAVDNTFSGILGNRKTMIMGADVTHPTDRMSYSIAACVASVDKDQTKYAASVRLQDKSKEEIITNLPDMVYELFKTFIARNQSSRHSIETILPEKLIFYRDGVSDV